MIKHALPVITFALLVLASGVAQGVRTDRWTSSTEVDEAVKRLDGVPQTLGDWHGEKSVLDANDLRGAGIRGHVAMRYHNVVTGKNITMLIVCGRAGRIAVHTPDICYRAAGYEAVGDPERKQIEVGKDLTLSMKNSQFKAPPSKAASVLDIYWAWDGGDGWVAPDNPRISLSRYGAVYKLYVIEEISPIAAAQKDRAVVSFLQLFLPRLEVLLSPRS